ncbi:MAG: hypothetical protein IJC29_01560 [Clostridia bacterium]|nr:hypothetical protein [Clostridia bacterium]
MPKIGDTVYYRAEDEEHSGIERSCPTVDEHFRYVPKCLLWRACAFVVYRLIITPFAFLWCKLKFRHKIKNKRVLRACRDRGLFLYGNHTLMSGDAYIPSLVTFPKRCYVVVNPQNLSVRGTRNLLKMCGAIPTPTTYRGLRSFSEALEKRTVQNHAVTVYPEAHIWPYYTGIRPFPETSFTYPVRMDEAVYCFTNTFHRRRLGKTPKVITYVDGPFYPDATLPRGERAKDLRDRVYATMCARAALSTYAPITYIKEETPSSDKEN